MVTCGETVGETKCNTKPNRPEAGVNECILYVRVRGDIGDQSPYGPTSRRCTRLYVASRVWVPCHPSA